MSMRNVYRKVAKQNGVTLAEVKRDIKTAVDYTYQNTPDDGVTAAYQNRIPRKGEIPTPEEFIHYVAEEAKRRNKK